MLQCPFFQRFVGKALNTPADLDVATIMAMGFPAYKQALASGFKLDTLYPAQGLHCVGGG